MAQRRLPNTRFALAVLIAAKGFDVKVPRFKQRNLRTDNIQQKTDRHRGRYFQRQNFDDQCRRYRIRNQNRQHFIGGRNKNRHQRSRRDNPRRIKIGGGSGQTALRKNTAQSADQRSDFPGFADQVNCAVTHPPFKIFQHQISHEQKRKQLNRFLQRLRGHIIPKICHFSPFAC